MPKIRSVLVRVLCAGVALGAMTGGADAQPVSLTKAQRASLTDALGVSALDGYNIALPDAPDPATPLVVPVRLDGQDVTLTLSVRSLRTEDSEMLLDDGSGKLKPAPLPPVRTLRGHVNEWPSARVAASLMPGGGLRALVAINGRTLVVQPARDADPRADRFLHLVFDADDLLDDGKRCGVDEWIHTPDVKDAGTGQFRLRGATTCYRLCEIAFDADFEFFTSTGSDQNSVIAEIESIMNGVDLIYQRDVGVTFGLTTFVVRTANNDPYTSFVPGGVLDELRGAYQNNTIIPRDIMHLFTGKELDTDTVGLAYIGVVCSRSFGYGLSQSYYSANFVRRTRLTTHEIGHNYNAPHDNEQGSTCSATPAGFVMNPNINSGGDVFSTCSIGRIEPHRDSRTCTPEGANVPPNTQPDFRATYKNNGILIDVLANDTDSCDDIDLLLFASLSSHSGAISISVGTGPGGRDQISYTPANNYVGSDTFQYTARGGNGLLAQETVTVDVTLGRTPDNPAMTQPGLNVSYYALSNPTQLPVFSELNAYTSATIPFINFGPAAGLVITSGRSDNVGAVITGYLNVPTSGLWTLFLDSDDGSRLYIGDEMVVNNDGERSATAEVSGQIPLAAGKHAIRVEYFEKVGIAGIIMRMQGPGFTKQIPNSTRFVRLLPCAADWNNDGFLNDTDFFDWVNDFFSQTGPRGHFDFNNDTFQNDQDWFDFLNAFFDTGC